MYCCASVQFGIEIVFLLCQKQPKALQYLPIFHQNRQKQNGSKCTNDNPSTSPFGLYWFSNRFASVKYTTVRESNLVFFTFILQILQSKRNNGLFCVYSECTCVDVMYFVLVCTRAYHMEKHKTYKSSKA